MHSLRSQAALGRLAGAWVAVLLAAACASPAPQPPPLVVSEPREGSGADGLLDLAEQALAAGELDTAAERFHRVAALHPGSVRARTGLGRVALARGETAKARSELEAALALDGDRADTLVALAELEIGQGGDARAVELLSRAVVAEDERHDAHARLAELTGRTASAAPSSVEDALRGALRHPYDPQALLLAGRRFAEEGRSARARVLLERVLWLSDLDPAAALAASRLLPELDATWSERRVVAVHVFADETIRAERGWRFRLRSLWRHASEELDGLLGVRFLPVSMTAFATRDLGPKMDPLFARLGAVAARGRPAGILAGFTARPAPRVPGARLGLARFLGRLLLVRLPPQANRSRVLAHELLHLYGAIHVSEDLDSLMNPTGGSFRLDPANARILEATRARAFSAAGFESDVESRIDYDETLEAYAAAVRLNLAFRQAGIADALEARQTSRYTAARRARRARQLDPHLADVSMFLARLMLADERRAEALLLFDLAADLYGRGTRKGRVAESRVNALMAEMERLYGR